MIFLKVIFWMYVVTVVINLGQVCADHPRKRAPINLGTDLVNWILNTLTAVVLWVVLWGNK